MRARPREIVQGLFLVVVLLFIDFTSVAGSCSNGIAQILPVMLYDMECEVKDSDQCFSNKMELPGQPGSGNLHLVRRASSGLGPETVSVVDTMEVGIEPYEQLGDWTTRFMSDKRDYLITHFPGFHATRAQGFTASMWFKYSETTNSDGIFFAIGGEGGLGYYITIGRHLSTERVRYTVFDGKVTTLEAFAGLNVWHRTSFSIGPAPDFCWYITLDGNNICNCCRKATAMLYTETGINGNINHAKILLGSFSMHSGQAMDGFLDDVRVYNKVVSYQVAMSSINNVPGTGACSNCPIGEYSTISATTCTPCPGQYSATALTDAHLTQSSLGCIQFV